MHLLKIRSEIVGIPFLGVEAKHLDSFGRPVVESASG